MMKGTTDSMKITATQEFSDCLNVMEILPDNFKPGWLETVISTISTLARSISQQDFLLLSGETWVRNTVIIKVKSDGCRINI